MGMFEHLYKNSRRYYTDFIALGDIYAVCWYSDLLDIVDSGSSKKSDTMDKKIYRIMADDKYSAARKFLVQKFWETKDISAPECKENSIKEIIESTLKNGKMKCLKSDPVLEDLSYDIETVIEGQYYTINEEDSMDKNQARIKAIMNNIDYSEALEHLTYEVIVDVFVEAHLYDVAVIGLSHIPIGPGYSSMSGMR